MADGYTPPSIEREYVIVRSLADLMPGDYVVHPVIAGFKVCRNWQPTYDAQVRADARERIAQAIEAACPGCKLGDPCPYEVAARIARSESCPDGVNRHTTAVALDCPICHPEAHQGCGGHS